MAWHTIGIDQGTTQTTAVIIDERSSVLAKNSIQLSTFFPQSGWVEQDPWEILESVKSAVAPLIETYPVRSVGFDNQGETFVLWDRDSGQPLTKAIVWQDKRAVGTCKILETQIDKNWLYQKTGLLLDSYFSAPKLRFLLENDPPLQNAVQNGRVLFGTMESWVLWHLSNRMLHVTDPSTASRTLLFNINQMEWDDELLSLFDVPREILPKVVPSVGNIGTLNFGTGADIPLNSLLVDQQAALFGQACFAPGEMKCTLGTGSFLLANTGSIPVFGKQGLLTTVAWQFPEQTTYALDGGIFVAGAAVQWLVENLELIPNAEASSATANQSLDREVTFVPALSGLAAPHWKTDTHGAIFGLSRGTSSADIVRATLEGIGCRIYEVVTTMAQAMSTAPLHLKVDGGPAANSYLMQFLADLLEIEIQVPIAQEATAIGIAQLAMHHTQGISLDELASYWKVNKTYYPQMNESTRKMILARWQRALEGLQYFHS